MAEIDRTRTALTNLRLWRGAEVPKAVARAVLRAARRGHSGSMWGLVVLSHDRTIDALEAIIRGTGDPEQNRLALARALAGDQDNTGLTRIRGRRR